MAVRITHVNNSSGHDGTYVYRSTSPMDPQALPAPLADAPPATGATFEYIDDPEDGAYYYRTQDHEGGQVSAVSDEVSIEVGFVAQVGDEVEGGIYAGMITYADAREFHIIAGKAESEIYGLQWKVERTETPGAFDDDDGLSNTQAMEAWGIADHPAGEHCVTYAGGGYSDWHMPSRNELGLISNNLRGHPEFSDNTTSTDYTYTSTDYSFVTIWTWRLSDNTEQSGQKAKDSATSRTRPIRRIPA